MKQIIAPCDMCGKPGIVSPPDRLDPRQACYCLCEDCAERSYTMWQEHLTERG